MKIIKKADTTQWSHRVTCDMCDSELQVESSDVKYQYHEGYDQREPAYDEYYTFCPVCSVKIDIPDDKIPKALKVQVKKPKSYGGPFDR